MKKNEIIFVGVLIIIAVAIIFVITRGNKNDGNAKDNQTKTEENYNVLIDGTKLNKSDKIKDDRTYNGLKFSNFQLTEKNGKTTLLADVTNTTSSDISGFTTVDITFYDKSNKEMGKVVGLIAPLKASATTELNANLTFDCANAYDLKITKHAD